MEGLLFNMLQGPLGSMGVSEADLRTYITACINYIYGHIEKLIEQLDFCEPLGYTTAQGE